MPFAITLWPYEPQGSIRGQTEYRRPLRVWVAWPIAYWLSHLITVAFISFDSNAIDIWLFEIISGSFLPNVFYLQGVAAVV